MAELPHPSRATDLPSLERLLDDWPDAVSFYDEDGGRFLFVNKAAEEVVGYRRDEIMVLRPKDLSHPDDASEIPAVLAQADRDGWVRRPWRLLQKDGVSIQTEMTLSRRVIDGRVIAQCMFRVVGEGALSDAPVDPSTAERLKSLDRTSLGVVTLDREGVVT